MARNIYSVNSKSGRNRSDKLTSLFQDKNTKKIYVGVQGTSEWYSYDKEDKDKAKFKYEELLNSNID